MNKLVWTLIAGLLCGTPFLHGQDTRFGVAFRAEYEMSTLLDIDLNDFYRGYNAYFSGVIPTPFDTLEPMALSHPAFGGGMRMEMGEGPVGFAIGFYVTFGRKEIRQEAEFQNGLKTRTDLKVGDLNAVYDLGIHIKHTLFIQVHMAGRFRENELALGYVYQDGSYSLGDEYDILGVYTASTTTLDLGGSIGLKLGPLYIPVSISFPTNAFSDDGLLSLLDFDKRQARWTDLPRDFDTWVNDPANIDLDNGFVRAESFRSVRINIGAEFTFGSGRNR
ncbi:MAG: hypothetical protein AAFV07_07180 [Bacteroidota bacterium]